MILISALVVIDYCGILKKCNIIVDNFNFDFWNIFINALIVITLYIITYILIDKRAIKQENNKKNIAKSLLIESYKNCIEDIEWMENSDYRNHVASNINFNEYLNDNSIYKRLIETPFENQEMILSFAKEGVITDKQLKDYLEVKKEFRKFITMSIVFFDKYELSIKQQETLRKSISKAKNNLF